jgi:uncharacterized protein YegJ (DUF2314 family)
MRLLTCVFVILSGVVIGCGKGDPASSPESGDAKHSAGKAIDDDTRMKHATEKARRTVKQFIGALQKPSATVEQFSFRMMFTDGKNRDDIWLNDVTYDGSKFHGVVGFDSNMVRDVKRGQKVSVEPGKISDWMYVENGKLVGGYTIRAERERLSPEEKAQFDMSNPYAID